MCALHSTAFISLFELTKGLKLCTPVLDIFSQCHHIFPWYAKLYIYCAMAIRLYISGRPRTLLSFSIGYYIYVEYGQYTHKSGLFQTSSITKWLVLFLFRFNCVARGTCFFFVFSSSRFSFEFGHVQHVCTDGWSLTWRCTKEMANFWRPYTADRCRRSLWGPVFLQIPFHFLKKS